MELNYTLQRHFPAKTMNIVKLSSWLIKTNYKCSSQFSSALLGKKNFRNIKFLNCRIGPDASMMTNMLLILRPRNFDTKARVQ